ncbi:hypothetical protein MRX96_026908 [Rhipicephalus microplus]
MHAPAFLRRARGSAVGPFRIEQASRLAGASPTWQQRAHGGPRTYGSSLPLSEGALARRAAAAERNLAGASTAPGVVNVHRDRKTARSRVPLSLRTSKGWPRCCRESRFAPRRPPRPLARFAQRLDRFLPPPPHATFNPRRRPLSVNCALPCASTSATNLSLRAVFALPARFAEPREEGMGKPRHAALRTRPRCRGCDRGISFFRMLASPNAGTAAQSSPGCYAHNELSCFSSREGLNAGHHGGSTQCQ